jgi:F0F1-type ATP synthase assembly protein I
MPGKIWSDEPEAAPSKLTGILVSAVVVGVLLGILYLTMGPCYVKAMIWTFTGRVPDPSCF